MAKTNAATKSELDQPISDEDISPDITGNNLYKDDNILLPQSVLACGIKVTSNVARQTVQRELPDSKEPSKDINDNFSTSANPKDMGIVFTSAREGAGMTKVAVAKKLETTHQAIMKIERGEQNPTLSTITNLAGALGYTVRFELVKNDSL